MPCDGGIAQWVECDGTLTHTSPRPKPRALSIHALGCSITLPISDLTRRLSGNTGSPSQLISSSIVMLQNHRSTRPHQSCVFWIHRALQCRRRLMSQRRERRRAARARRGIRHGPKPSADRRQTALPSALLCATFIKHSIPPVPRMTL